MNARMDDLRSRLYKAEALLRRITAGRKPHAHPDDKPYWDGSGVFCDVCAAYDEARAFLEESEVMRP